MRGYGQYLISWRRRQWKALSQKWWTTVLPSFMQQRTPTMLPMPLSVLKAPTSPFRVILDSPKTQLRSWSWLASESSSVWGSSCSSSSPSYSRIVWWICWWDWAMGMRERLTVNLPGDWRRRLPTCLGWACWVSWSCSLVTVKMDSPSENI